MGNEKTSLYDVKQIDKELTKKILDEVYEALDDRGYNPTNQIVGYLISGDPGYITSFKDARKLITSLDRSKALEVVVKKVLP